MAGQSTPSQNDQIPLLETHRGEFTISTNPSRLNVEAICAFLENTYWGKSRSRAVMEKSFQHSFCFGVYHSGEQIGFVRAVTDYSTYAYLADVYILEPFRGKGLGHWLIETVLSHPHLSAVRRWGLITQDAHDLYRSFGFCSLKHPNQHMELRLPDEPPTILPNHEERFS